MSWPGSVVLQLAPQVSHVDANVVSALLVGGSPYLQEYLAMREDSSDVLDHRREQSILEHGEMNLGVPLANQALGEIDLYVTETEDRRTLVGGADLASQDGPNACEQLADAERLCQVIIGACVQGVHLLALAHTRREHDQRHDGPGPQIADEIDPVAIWQSKVQDDDVGISRPAFDQSLLDRSGLEDLPALRFQRDADEPANLRFVLDQHRDGRNGAHVSERCTPPSTDSSGGGMSGGVPRGRVKRNCAPPPGFSCAQMRPLCASIMARLMASPSPTPGVADSRAPRVNFSKID